MKTEKNILIAFILNLAFSVFEIVGGIFTGSIAIVSDAIHDMADAASIGISWFLERKSKRKPDATYTYGYARYSVIGSAVTTLILLLGSLAVMYKAIMGMISPGAIHYDGMIVLAVVGVAVNFIAAFVTRHGDSLNQKAVSLHMLEDVLGWVVVLIGAMVMRFTEFTLIDPIMSIGVALFIMVNAMGNLKEILDVVLEKVPHGLSVDEIREHVGEIEGVRDVHHIHIWSLDGKNHCATAHIVAQGNFRIIKERVRRELSEHGIGHVTLELEQDGEECRESVCHPQAVCTTGHHHHHHH